MKIIILAAGKGTRLGRNEPKILTNLPNNETIMDRLINAITPCISQEHISIVVGYKKKMITTKYPTLNYIVNDKYENTNTAKSLLLALNNIENEDVVWINGDLIIDENIFKKIYSYIGDCMAVSNTAILDEEEIKYTIDAKGHINNVSKEINNGIGEAFGLNKISKKNLYLFKESLKKCANNDYFERGIEIAISNGLIINPLDVGNMFYTEVDFEKDLNYAINFLAKQRM
tara:strand:+ start:399 stop:1088 length:690 start_codon:yes stop_codon:yes gene_type:complete